jgi:hypothetical protein
MNHSCVTTFLCPIMQFARIILGSNALRGSRRAFSRPRNCRREGFSAHRFFRPHASPPMHTHLENVIHHDEILDSRTNFCENLTTSPPLGPPVALIVAGPLYTQSRWVRPCTMHTPLLIALLHSEPYVLHTTHGRARDRTRCLDAVSRCRGAADETTWCAPFS